MNKITLGIVAALFSASASASWTFTDLSTSSGSSMANSINNSNQIVGFQRENVGNQSIIYATSWQNGVSSYISPQTFYSPFGEYLSRSIDINNNGQIVAFVALTHLGSNYRTLLIENGVPKTLSYPSDKQSFFHNVEINNNAEVIANLSKYLHVPGLHWDSNGTPQIMDKVIHGFNDHNKMVGQATISGEKHAVLYDNGNTIDLGKGFSWAISSNAVDINNAGQILATGFGATTGHRSFLIDGDKIRSLKSSGERSEGVALNEYGIVAGHQYIDIKANSPHYPFMQTEAVIWDGHNQYKLNDFLDQDLKDAGWVLVTANDINDNGWVVGEAYNMITGVTHAYSLSTDEMLSPIPEPSTYLMLMAGLGLLGFMRYKKT